MYAEKWMGRLKTKMSAEVFQSDEAIRFSHVVLFVYLYFPLFTTEFVLFK